MIRDTAPEHTKIITGSNVHVAKLMTTILLE